jgi:mono/diheme cytochrome c family protein
MESETVFYVLGIGLTLAALVVSFVGLRFEGFPKSRPLLAGVIGVFAALVLGSAAFAWMAAEDEQEHRDQEIAAGHLPSPQEVTDEMAASTAEQVEEGEASGEPVAGEADVPADGQALFDAQGCGSCHALEAAGSTGEVGSDLAATLRSQDAAYIEESITDPDAEIAKGFPEGVMPDNFGEVLSPEELDALVQYIADSVGAKQ